MELVNLDPQDQPLDAPDTGNVTEPVKEVVEFNPFEIASRAEALSLDVGTKDAETKRQNTLGETTAIQEAKGAVLAKLSPQQVAEKAISEGKSIDEIIQEYNDTYAKTEKVVTTTGYYKLMGVTTEDPYINAAGANYITNINIAVDILSNELSKREYGLGWVGMAGHFIDRFFIRQIPIGDIEDMTHRSERMGMSLMTAAVTLPQDEYRVYIKNFVDGLKDEGFFTSNNIFALQAGLSAATNSGYDPEANTAAILGAVDIGITFGPALLKATKLTKLLKADSATAIEVVAHGPESAAEKVAKAVVDGDAPAGIAKEVDPKVLSLDEPSRTQAAGGVPTIDFNANTERTAQIIKEGSFIKRMGEILASGAAGRVASPVIVAERLEQLLNTFKKTYATPIMNYAISTDVLDNKIAHIWVGNKKGGVWGYNQKHHAVAAAEGIEGASVVRVMKDGKQGYAVQVSKRMDLAKGELMDLSTPFKNIVSELVTRFSGSAALRDLERLDILHQMGEGVQSAFKELSKPLLLKLKAIPKEKRVILSQILGELRDSPTRSSKREWHTDAEFIAEYKAKHPTNAAPTEKVMEAWRAIVDLSDASYIVKANEILHKYVSKGFSKIRLNPEITMPAKKVDKIADGEKYVWDVKHQYMAKVGKETESAKSIYKLDKPFTAADGSTATHAIDPSEVGILEFHDVLGYNAGGHRTNPNARYFLVLLNKLIKKEDPGIPKGHTRLYRVDGGETPTEISEWVKDSPQFKQTQKATGRWFAGTLDEAEWYLKEYPNGTIKYIDVPSGSVKPLSETTGLTADGLDPKKFSRRPDVEYFVTREQADLAKDLPSKLPGSSGNAMRPKAMLSAYSLKEILKAETELKALALARKEGYLTDEFVAAHSGWDEGVDTVAKFEARIKENEWDLDRVISHKERNAQAVTDDAEHPMFGSTMEDYIKTDMKRVDDVLPEYGGGHNYNVDPLNSIFQNYGNVANTLATRAWSVNAMNSWVATALARRDLVRIPSGMEGNIYGIFRDAEIIGKSPEAMRLKELRNIMRRRMSVKDEVGKALEDFGNSVAEYVFDSPLKWKLNDLNPTNRLLTLGFHSAFGFFNVSQLFMQGFQAATIMAVSPKHGWKGVGLTWPMRAVLNAGDTATEKLAIKRMAAGSNLSEESITELAAYIRTSGRSIVDGDMMELGTSVGQGISSASVELIKKVSDGGLMFFRAGERLSRLTGINTAFLEFKELYPTMSALSDFGRSWIARREGALTQHMTTGSKSAMQTGPGGLLRMPTQWLAFSFRAMESIVFGTGGLSRWERVRLFAVLGPMFGTTGFGFANASDWVEEALGIEPGSDAHTFVRYGIPDWLIGQATGLDTAVASRLAPVDQFVDMYDKIFGEDKSFKEVTLGPSGAIIGDLVTAGWNVVADAFHMRPVSLSADVITLLKQPSGLSNIAKAYGIMNNGLYQSKTGTYFPGKFTTGDAIMQGIGFTPQEVIEMSQRRTQTWGDNKSYKEFSTNMNKKAEQAFVMISEGNVDDMAAGLSMLKEINTQVKLSNFSPTQMRSITTGIWRKDKNLFLKVMEDLQRAGRTHAARTVGNLMEDMK